MTLLATIQGACAQTSRPVDAPFVFVFIDDATEKALGPFPYDRSVLAKGVDKAASSGAKGVVLKFFIDKHKTSEGDHALVKAAIGTKLILESRLDDQEANSNPLPDRFYLLGSNAAVGNPLSGTSGWLPLPELSAVAYDVGFVDYRVADRMPLVECYKNRIVKSLYLCCIELAMGKHGELSLGKSLRIHDKALNLDERSEAAITYPKKDALPYISFCDFISAEARPEVRDRVVIIGYDSERFAAVDTPLGKVRPHRAFAYALMSLYAQLH